MGRVELQPPRLKLNEEGDHLLNPTKEESMANFSRSFSSEYSLAILRARLACFGDFLKAGRVLERVAHDDERDDERDDEHL